MKFFLIKNNSSCIVFDGVCPKLCKSLFLFFIHVKIVFLGIPNFSDAVPLVILFSISQLILNFCVNEHYLSFRLIANILVLNHILLYDPTMVSFLIHIYIKCKFQISKIDNFSSILQCCRRTQYGNVRDKERRTCQRTECIFEIGKYSRLGAFKIKREEKKLEGYIKFQRARVSV